MTRATDLLAPPGVRVGRAAHPRQARHAQRGGQALAEARRGWRRSVVFARANRAAAAAARVCAKRRGAAGEAPLLSGASLDVHTWKASQEWWEALGWATVRWQSHVPARAALTVNVAAAGAPTPEEMGPRGPLAGSSAAVVQLHYKYGCRKVDPRGAGLAAIVLAAADGVPPQDELEDPDCYPIEIE